MAFLLKVELRRVMKKAFRLRLPLLDFLGLRIVSTPSLGALIVTAAILIMARGWGAARRTLFVARRLEAMRRREYECFELSRVGS